MIFYTRSCLSTTLVISPTPSLALLTIMSSLALLTSSKNGLSRTNTVSRKSISQRLRSDIRPTTHFACKCTRYLVGFGM